MFGKKKDATNADSAESADGDEIKSEDIASAPPLKMRKKRLETRQSSSSTRTSNLK